MTPLPVLGVVMDPPPCCPHDDTVILPWHVPGDDPRLCIILQKVPGHHPAFKDWTRKTQRWNGNSVTPLEKKPFLRHHHPPNMVLSSKGFNDGAHSSGYI